MTTKFSDSTFIVTTKLYLNGSERLTVVKTTRKANIEYLFIADIAGNAQLAGVRPPTVNSTKLAKLPNHHNSIYKVLRGASKKPELEKLQKR